MELKDRRPFHAHPAVGVATVGSTAQALSDVALGPTWARLTDEQREDEETNFFTVVLRFLASLPDGPMRFRVEATPGEVASLVENLADESIFEVRGSQCEGALSFGSAALLVRRDPVCLQVYDRKGELVLEQHDSWTGVTVRLRDDQLRGLRAALEPNGWLRGRE